MTFADDGAAGTRLEVRQTVPDDAPVGEGQEEHWGEALDRLAAHLASR